MHDLPRVLRAETLPRAQSKKTAWILRQICHDWPDAETVRILRSIREAMEPHQEHCTLCLVEVRRSALCRAKMSSLCIAGTVVSLYACPRDTCFTMLALRDSWDRIKALASSRAASRSDVTWLTFARSHNLSAVQAVITSRGVPTADVRDRARTASDLHMMIQHDGKERDAHQWADILSKVCASQEWLVRSWPLMCLCIFCMLRWCMPENLSAAMHGTAFTPLTHCSHDICIAHDCG